MSTPGFELDFVGNGSVGGEVTLNKGLNTIDSLIGLEVVGFDTNAPPGSPVNGQSWKIGASPTGAWVGNADNIATWNDGWNFAESKQGMILFDPIANVLKRLDDKGADTWIEYGEQSADIGVMGSMITISGSGEDADINSNFSDIKDQLDAIRDNMRTAKLMA